MLKLETDIGVICLGYAFVLWEYYKLIGIRYGLVLEILGTVGLCLGVSKKNPYYLLPWLLFNGFYMSLNLYVLIYILLFERIVPARGDHWTFFWLLLNVAIFCVALYSVCQAFCRMRKVRAEPTSTTAV